MKVLLFFIVVAASLIFTSTQSEVNTHVVANNSEPSQDNKTQDYQPPQAAIFKYLQKKCFIGDLFTPLSSGKALDVNITLELYKFYGINDLEQSFSCLADFKFRWTNPCVHWGDDNETAQWAGENYVAIQPDKVWRPVFQHMESSTSIFDINKMGLDTLILIDNDGRFQFEAMGRFETNCQLDFTAFPFDTQTCQLQIETFQGYSAIRFSLVSMVLYSKNDFMDPGLIWNLEGTDSYIINMTYTGDPEIYTRAVFELKLRRRYHYYVGTMLIPHAALSLLELAGLLMEPGNSDRPTFTMTVILALSVLMTFINEIVPKTSQIILISLNLTCHFVLGAFLTLYSLVSCSLAKHKYFRAKVCFRCRIITSKVDNSVCVSEKHTFMRRIRYLDIFIGTVVVCLVIFLNAANYCIITA